MWRSHQCLQTAFPSAEQGTRRGAQSSSPSSTTSTQCYWGYRVVPPLFIRSGKKNRPEWGYSFWKVSSNNSSFKSLFTTHLWLQCQVFSAVDLTDFPFTANPCCSLAARMNSLSISHLSKSYIICAWIWSRFWLMIHETEEDSADIVLVVLLSKTGWSGKSS